MVRRYGDKKELTPQHYEALDQINGIIRGLAFKKDDVQTAKDELARYLPKQVFLDKYGHEDGWAILYAIYAPQIVNDYFREAKRHGEKVQSPKHRRHMFEELGGDSMDYVQNVYMGYQERAIKEDASESSPFRGGIRSVAVPGTKYVYNPSLGGKKDVICPHCKVSFWEHLAGNTDPQYQHAEDKDGINQPVRPWRGNKEEAPEHVRYNPSTGDRTPSGATAGYSYCGGQFPIYDVTTNTGEPDIEAAERLSGVPWDTLVDQERVQTLDLDGDQRYFLVDEHLDEVEHKLQESGHAPYKVFNDDWLVREMDSETGLPSENLVQGSGGEYYRECRHPIDLKSPSSVIYDRIAKYTYQAPTGKTKQATKIKVYKCPNCPGEFQDIEGITKGADGKTEVQCDGCGSTFNINDLSKDEIYEMTYVPKQISLWTSPGAEGEGHLIDTLGQEDIGFAAPQVAEVIHMFEDEINKAAMATKIRGAEHAADIFFDWVVQGLNYKEITQKYFSDLYQLHYTQCLDCGYTEEEKANPDKYHKEYYDAGIPINLKACKLRYSHPNHKVELPSNETPEQEEQVEQANPFAAHKDTSRETRVNKTEVPIKQKTDPGAEFIEDEEMRRRYLGQNLIYHGQAPKGSGLPGVSYLVKDVEKRISEKLDPADPRAYKGDGGVITSYIYAPTSRLIKAVIQSLRSNQKLLSKYPDIVEILEEWGQHLEEQSQRLAKSFRGFCKT